LCGRFRGADSGATVWLPVLPLVAIELTLKLLVKLKVRLPPTVVFTDGASFRPFSEVLLVPFFSCGARASANCLWSRLGTKYQPWQLAPHSLLALLFLARLASAARRFSVRFFAAASDAILARAERSSGVMVSRLRLPPFEPI